MVYILKSRSLERENPPDNKVAWGSKKYLINGDR